MTGDSLLKSNPLWVVDVGASGGIDPRWSEFTSFYKGVLFEPDPREYEVLKERCENNLVVLNSALSDSPREIDFYLCKKQQVSSVYPPNRDFLDRFPEADRHDIVKKIRLKADTLDNQLENNGISEINFIKIDAQGHELPILKGCERLLEGVVGLELEAGFVPLYKGQPLFDEMDRHVRDRGFELFDLKRYFWNRAQCENTGSQKGQLIFCDALYFKSPEKVMGLDGISKGKITCAICVYLVYGYLDLAQTLVELGARGGLFQEPERRALQAFVSTFEKGSTIPNFRGRWRVRSCLQRMLKLFDVNGWADSDQQIGNA